ncbi:hypothetical protein BC941DRAFT_137433 [Chlamydoabsidia padenii]|nr:hypothetical protein BC941DRAFT_137433 [Chlamydoabsidia padenii]
MELLLITSLMTILDKAGDNGWKKETSGGFLEPNEIPSVHHPGDDDDNEGNDSDSDSTHRLGGKEQQQKEKSERNIEQRLQWMLEKDVRRSQKQLKRQQTGYASQQQSPLGSPRGSSSPIPSPSTSTHDLRLSQQRQQLEHLSQVLSAMKHSGDATATLPSYFVQQTTATGPTTQLQSMWDNNNYHEQKQQQQQQQQQDEDEDYGIPSRHHNSHHRSQSQRRLSATDPYRVAALPYQRAPPSMTSYTTNNNRYSVPVPPRQYYIQQHQR